MKAAIAFAALLSIVAADASATTATASEYPSNQAIMQNQLLVWLPIIFVFLALLTASKIDTDNTPNKKMDSILYARFLTNPPNKDKAM